MLHSKITNEKSLFNIVTLQVHQYSKPEIPTVLGDFNKSEKMQIILFVIGGENKKTERKSEGVGYVNFTKVIFRGCT